MGLQKESKIIFGRASQMIKVIFDEQEIQLLKCLNKIGKGGSSHHIRKKKKKKKEREICNMIFPYGLYVPKI